MEQRRYRLRRDQLTISLASVDAQEQRFAQAFARPDLSSVRDLYHPDVVYLSPTTRLFDRPPRIEGVDATLEFIALTIEGCTDIEYRVDERAVVPEPQAAFVRVTFDFDLGVDRLRSVYAVLYHYRDGLIGQQELFYDPSGPFEKLRSAGDR
ncbi:MAG TPA: nuclear transport factor 2 family protein [Acidimicrobiales bacterium]|nr:nuclear transport factor 2 family protein [Acidimicrobiales bacterium]